MQVAGQWAWLPAVPPMLLFFLSTSSSYFLSRYFSLQSSSSAPAQGVLSICFTDSFASFPVTTAVALFNPISFSIRICNKNVSPALELSMTGRTSTTGRTLYDSTLIISCDGSVTTSCLQLCLQGVFFFRMLPRWRLAGVVAIPWIRKSSQTLKFCSNSQDLQTFQYELSTSTEFITCLSCWMKLLDIWYYY